MKIHLTAAEYIQGHDQLSGWKLDVLTQTIVTVVLPVITKIITFRVF